MSNAVAILGAHSTIAVAIAREFADQGHDIHLFARDAEQLEADANDINIRSGSSVISHSLDLSEIDRFKEILEAAPEISIVVSVLGRQEETTGDYLDADYRERLVAGNYTIPIAVAEVAATVLESRGGGVFVGISSVAGDRGRQSNYLYGSAKAGYTAFLSGLRNKLAKSNTHIVSVRPGIIKTPLTSKQDFPPALLGEASTVARDVYKAVRNRKNNVYTPWVWALIMLVIRFIPESIFKRLNL